MSAWVVRLQGWRKGPSEPITLMKLIRQTHGIGLRDAKKLVDNMFDEAVVFGFDDAKAAHTFCEAARATGAIVRVGQTS